MVNSLKRTYPLIQNTQFINQDYYTLNPINMFVYCDPPYHITKFPIKYRTDVKHYDIFDNNKFWNIMRIWSKNNIVIISETTAPEDFVEIWQQDRYRSAAQSTKTRFCDKSEINSDTHKTEKLFIHQSLIDDIQI
jgi:site-specific DNA-adenine methylase